MPGRLGERELEVQNAVLERRVETLERQAGLE